MRLDLSRAKQILKSKESCHITFDGTRVVIDDIFELSNMARIHDKENRSNEQVVSLSNLIEESQPEN
ncbi:H-type small acid-soluble spore protein [Cytobacillus horneckiae]|uniref:Small, acid-soluble spore protein, H family n=1 Tax=Cytobacillus horneckiae TaxID=549687 RepID=A0A2N0ZHX9_9BACI|nr:H-type small acid-soluble spore protein [Cytobacillus horneckiae]MBN6886911.1 small, acid-soluble spore protein, H family [Cytobacillus horneckiae]PKG29110.1 small, acid-soluble spore protein, H family [Cytobacillus horneckiae]